MVLVGKRKWQGLLFSLLLICFYLSAPAAAVELELGISSGYDDNPHQENGSEGARFSRTELDLGWALPIKLVPATTISLFGFAAYQCYSGLDDKWQLGGGLASTTQINNIPGTLSFFSEAACYRNPLVSDNDYDTFRLGSNFTWFAGPQLSIELETSLGWEDYCSRVSNGRHSHNNSSNSKYKNQTVNLPKHHNSGDRNDRLFTTSLKSFYAFSPEFEGGGTIFGRYRHSSIDAECRRAYGLNLDLSWQPIPAVDINWQLGGERVPYKYKYQKKSRTENIYNFGIMVSWYLHSFTLQSCWDWSKQSSIVNEDDYQRNQWQIRLKYSY